MASCAPANCICCAMAHAMLRLLATPNTTTVRPCKLFDIRSRSSASFGLFRPINLCALQLVGVIHVDRLPLGIEINRTDTAFTMAIAGGFHAAEWQMHLRADRGRVDVSDACI